MSSKLCLLLTAALLVFTGCGCSYSAPAAAPSPQPPEALEVPEVPKDPIISFCSSNDPPGTVDPGLDKDVGCCETSSSGPASATVSITNAYPDYQCRVAFGIKNIGEEPVTITGVELDKPLALDASVSPPDLVGTTIEPGQMITAYLDLRVNDLAREAANYNFELTINGE